MYFIFELMQIQNEFKIIIPFFKTKKRKCIKNDLDSFTFTHCRQHKEAKVLMYAIYELHLISSSDMLMNI